jgi:hypothetical protein
MVGAEALPFLGALAFGFLASRLDFFCPLAMAKSFDLVLAGMPRAIRRGSRAVQSYSDAGG